MLKLGLSVAWLTASVLLGADVFEGWTTGSPRPELQPQFVTLRRGGPHGEPVLIIRIGSQAGKDGWWVKEFPVAGGQWYRFRVYRHLRNVPRSVGAALIQLDWLDANGRAPRAGEDEARTEYPSAEASVSPRWTEISGVYRAPDGAVKARVRLRLRWAPNAEVQWASPKLEPADSVRPRLVRLAAVHFRPRGGKTIEDNCRLFVPFIEEAARQRADLVVLPEYALSQGLPGDVAARSQPLPGPATRFFQELAARYDMYIVVTLLERAGPLVYNTAALVGPEGYLGRYRKVCLPREEYDAGIAAGNEYPVFRTRFGTVGIMICWDLQFPQIAWRLARAGAEVIACPIAGGNPQLAAARAIENQVYLVTSTYNTRPNWMVTGIWDPTGQLVASTDKWGSVLVHEVDLNRRILWWWIGDLKSRIPYEAPAGW